LRLIGAERRPSGQSETSKQQCRTEMAQNVSLIFRPKSRYGSWFAKPQWYHFRVTGRTAGYVLVGGRSSRMGRDKATLPYHGTTLAQWVAQQVLEAAGSATLVGNTPLGIPDLYPGEGPLGGIITALDHSRAEWNLVVACDMPHAEAPLLRHLLDTARESAADALIPHGPSGLPEPLCAVYRRSALDTIRANFAAGTRKVMAGLEGLAVVRLEVGEAAQFQNLNTPEDWSAHAGK
jgi:molybdopterin-guanine dinucleotide biosynthesis protein A